LPSFKEGFPPLGGSLLTPPPDVFDEFTEGPVPPNMKPERRKNERPLKNTLKPFDYQGFVWNESRTKSEGND
jgi:hypothetical protein